MGDDELSTGHAEFEMPQGHPTFQSVRHVSDTSMVEGQLKPCHHSEQETTDRALETPVLEAAERQRSLHRAGRRKEKGEQADSSRTCYFHRI